MSATLGRASYHSTCLFAPHDMRPLLVHGLLCTPAKSCIALKALFACAWVMGLRTVGESANSAVILVEPCFVALQRVGRWALTGCWIYCIYSRMEG